MLLEIFVDPTVVFCVSCLLTPLYLKRDKLTRQIAVDYFTEPSLATCLAAVPLAWFIAVVWRSRVRTSLRQRKDYQEEHKRELEPYERVNYDAMMAPLTYGERTRARWYLLNGIIIHIFMDGCVGVLKTNKLLADNYAKLDKRYGDRLGTFNGSAVHVVSLAELLVKGPLCVVLYWAFKVRHPMRDALEFFTCVTQVYGTIVYLGQEAISGAHNLDVDYKLSFTLHYLFYFWFAIIFGCVLYLIVPAVLGYRSYLRLCRQATFYLRHHYSGTDYRGRRSHLAPH